ncbi:MAG: hypothetical protein D4R64_08360 [Porphyromonadaceae bacterium]|nr:MAG: hypothetical protein D4R64_08360 [Porphyromonadaceae bacterium]
MLLNHFEKSLKFRKPIDLNLGVLINVLFLQVIEGAPTAIRDNLITYIKQLCISYYNTRKLMPVIVCSRVHRLSPSQGGLSSGGLQINYMYVDDFYYRYSQCVTQYYGS